ncbi:hypothetical protein [Pseudomonas sp. CGJS7]|uniref:hypothetical protein n=1 Tax=Pseudomonas sp. CGJS7 TaxID=3109348 RepID=UPI00300A2A4B
MNRPSLPRALFSALVAAAAALEPAAALPPLRADLVDEATLATISGKYFGAQMLVGLRVDVISNLSTPQQGAAMASGSLLVLRDGAGLRVQVDARSQAVSGDAAAASTHANAAGADAAQVRGIGQIAQIAGDGNRLSNLAAIEFVDRAGIDRDAAGFNGQSHSESAAGAMQARVTFLDGGIQVGVDAPGAAMRQHLNAGAQGGIGQLGRIAGDGIDGGNRLQLQVATSAITPQLSQQLGLQQALDSLRALPR